MKRIGILSDTHSCWDDRYREYFRDCDEIWHAGDIGDISILERLREIASVVRAVSGNIDHGEVRRQCPDVLFFEVEDINIMLTHIGGYPNRWSPGVKKILKDKSIQLMVDGHSHILRVMYDADLSLLHINPGAAGHHGWQKVRTLVKCVIDGGIIRDAEVIELG